MAGRKSLYPLVKARFTEIRAAYEKGATDSEVIKMLGISTESFYKYQRENSEFIELIKESKKNPDTEVEAALFKLCTGFYESETSCAEDANLEGDTTRKTRAVRKYYPPNPTAIIFWLKNRRPKRWNDRHELGVGISGLPFNPDDEGV